MKPALRLALLLLAASGAVFARAAQPPLTVCADPNNLPFSNRQQQGFENRIVELLARDLGRKVNYLWWAQRRGFARNTLNQAACDLWPGVAAGMEGMATTQPYYESGYVFVTREARGLGGLDFDDARLRNLVVGVQMVGDDGMNTPPVHALARRGITANIRGFMLYGNYQQPNPPARIIEAVSAGTVDVAIVWGPLAGYFAARSAQRLRIEPVSASAADAIWPMRYAISMGVARDNDVLLAQLNRLLQKDAAGIEAILRDYHVPLFSSPPQP